MPGAVEALAVIVRTDEPEEVTLVGARVAVRPAGTVALRDTVPLKPPSPWTVILLVAVLPELAAFTVTHVGLAVRVKSWTLTVTIVLCDSAPLVPVTVTV